MGEDGATGIAHIKKLGGVTVVQEPETCAIRSMPLAAIATGSVDNILSPDSIADLISTYNPDAVHPAEPHGARPARGKK
jgi:chemotaxis response regulator CheB